MNDQSLLSIVILHYNADQFLCTSLANLVDFSGKVPYLKAGIKPVEIIVVDNKSPPESRKRLREQFNQWGGRIAPKAKEVEWQIEGKGLLIRYRELGKNLGFAAGNNCGVALSRGQYVLFLNPDTVVPAKTLAACWNFLEKHPRVGAVTSRLELADGRLDEACHRGFPTPWRAFCYFSGLEKIFPHSRLFAGYHLGWQLDNPRPHKIEAASGAFLLVRRQAGEAIGWWDEDYFFYGEDIEFCYQLARHRWPVYFLPQVKITHFRGVSSGLKKHSRQLARTKLAGKVRVARASVEAMRIFYRKHYRGKYPFWVDWMMKIAWWLLENYRVWRVRRG